MFNNENYLFEFSSYYFKHETLERSFPEYLLIIAKLIDKAKEFIDVSNGWERIEPCLPEWGYLQRMVSDFLYWPLFLQDLSVTGVVNW